MRKIAYVLIIFFIVWIGFLGFKFLNKKTEYSEMPDAKYQMQDINNLLLFYNKNLVSQPPATWQELLDNNYSTALGTADNIEYSSEILVLLMLQQGVEWPNFNNNLGKRALQFYTQFADKAKKAYTWDKTRQNSFEEFNSGNIAIIFAYSDDKLKFENINYGLVQMPRISLSQKTVDLPELSDSEKAVLDDMIESVSSGRATIDQAINNAANLIFNFQ